LQNEEGEPERCLHVNQNGKQGKNGHCDDDGSSVTTVSSPEPEEYTYERAIQGYVNFAETRVKSRAPVTRSNLNNSRNQLEKSVASESSTEKMSNGHNAKGLSSPPHTPRRQSGANIEEKLSALEKRRHSSTELNSSVNSDKKIPVAKGDVLKRREMFERACELSEQVSKPARRLSEGNQARLSHSESKGEAVKQKASHMSSENINRKGPEVQRHRFSNGDLSSALSVQERLSQLEKQGEEKGQASEDLSQSVKKRLSNLDAAYNKGDNRNITPDNDTTFQTKLANFSTEEKVLNGVGGVKDLGVGSVRSSSPEEDVIYESKRQQFHRSLDSLDVEGSSDVCNDSFERVQSLEDLDCCSHARNYPASASSTEMLVFSSQSGDTDRDDSGIHTADVSCSVSQADEPVDDGEIVATINSIVPRLETSSTGLDVYHLEFEIVNQKHVGSTVIEQKPPIPEPSDNVTLEPVEMATAFLDVRENLGSSSAVVEEVSMPETPEVRNNSVSPQFDVHS
jgi:F-box protein 20